LNRSQPRQCSAAARSFSSVGRAGMKSAAEPVGFAVFLGFVMLFPVFVEPVMALNRTAVRIDVVLFLRLLWRALRFLASTMLAVQPFDELRVGFFAVLTFGVLLRTLLGAVLRLRHVPPPV
jgi:hypothetical protein